MAEENNITIRELSCVPKTNLALGELFNLRPGTVEEVRRVVTSPAKWKEAEVIPIFKDGDHELAVNNRPLSLLPVASKLCEKIILKQFNTYLTNNKRLTSPQSGNKKTHSTETLNIQLTDSILEAMEKKTDDHRSSLTRPLESL